MRLFCAHFRWVRLAVVDWEKSKATRSERSADPTCGSHCLLMVRDTLPLEVGSALRADLGVFGRVERPRSTAADRGRSALPQARIVSIASALNPDGCDVIASLPMTGGSGWRLAVGSANPATWHPGRASSIQPSIQPSTQCTIQASFGCLPCQHVNLSTCQLVRLGLANRPTDQRINSCCLISLASLLAPECLELLGLGFVVEHPLPDRGLRNIADGHRDG